MNKPAVDEMFTSKSGECVVVKCSTPDFIVCDGERIYKTEEFIKNFRFTAARVGDGGQLHMF